MTSDTGFRNVLRARRLLSEGKCPYCERDMGKPPEDELADLEQAVDDAMGKDAGYLRYARVAKQIYDAGYRKCHAPIAHGDNARSALKNSDSK